MMMKNCLRERIKFILEKYSLKASENSIDRLIYLLGTFDEDILTNELLEKLVIENLTIGESYFFRDRETFNKLASIFKSKPFWKILSVGCSRGEEAYSAVITAQQSGVNCQIFGIDVNHQRIIEAKNGCYRFWSVRLLSEEEIKKYFDTRDGLYCINDEYKKNVTFLNGNILDHNFDEKDKFDIIFIRRVLIYTDNIDSIEKIINKVFSILKDDGYLILGNGEYFPVLYTYFEPVDTNSLAILRKTQGKTQAETVFALESLANKEKSASVQTKTLLQSDRARQSSRGIQESLVDSTGTITNVLKNTLKNILNDLSFEEELKIAENYMEQHKFNKSYELLKVLSRKYPSEYIVWKYRALVESELALKEEAMGSLKKALFLNHLDEEVWQLKFFLER
ncbi:MAG TPA: chemotaxis protein CheR [Fervidobacterium sp.]|nr:chemotaxis protein CheR [Fervidobacterium sp.]